MNGHEVVMDSVQKKDFDKRERLGYPFDFYDVDEEKTLVNESGITDDKSPSKYKRLDDEI